MSAARRVEIGQFALGIDFADAVAAINEIHMALRIDDNAGRRVSGAGLPGSGEQCENDQERKQKRNSLSVFHATIYLQAGKRVVNGL